MDEITKVRVDGVDRLITDEATRSKVTTLSNTMITVQSTIVANTERIAAVESSVTKIQQSDTETAQELTDHDSRITKAQNTADSNGTKYSALSTVVSNNTQKITDEIERAKDVEGALDQLTTTPKDNLVTAINWVLTKANKALENVGTLNDLTTSEKTDVVGAINELVTSIASLTTRVAALETAASSTAETE